MTGFIVKKVRTGGSWVDGFSMLLFYVCKCLLHREIPFKKWFEKQRSKEYSRKGFMELFIEGSKA